MTNSTNAPTIDLSNRFSDVNRDAVAHTIPYAGEFSFSPSGAEFLNLAEIDAKMLAAQKNDHLVLGMQQQDKICENCHCETITVAHLKTVWPKASDERLQIVADELNYSITIGLIDSELRISHFLGQALVETTPALNFVEQNIELYTPKRMDVVWKIYRDPSLTQVIRDPITKKIIKINYFPNALAKAHGTIADTKLKRETIANTAYAEKNGNGNAESGDGFRYIGRGMKQLSGRKNYRDFTTGYKSYWPEEKNPPDFEANPELVATTKYGTRAGLWYFASKGCASQADKGMNPTASAGVTQRINPGTDSIEQRYKQSEKIYNSGVFNKISYNTSTRLNNPKARNPKITKIL